MPAKTVPERDSQAQAIGIARRALIPGRKHAMDPKTTLTEQTPRTSVIDATAAPADDSAGNIDKVRDILFGGQMRDYERRFQRLEGRLTQEIGQLKDDVRQRLAALEQFMKQEAASLADRITTEHDERTDATKEPRGRGARSREGIREEDRPARRSDRTRAARTAAADSRAAAADVATSCARRSTTCWRS